MSTVGRIEVNFIIFTKGWKHFQLRRQIDVIAQNSCFSDKMSHKLNLSRSIVCRIFSKNTIITLKGEQPETIDGGQNLSHSQLGDSAYACLESQPLSRTWPQNNKSALVTSANLIMGVLNG